jgi:hypothetical protein
MKTASNESSRSGQVRRLRGGKTGDGKKRCDKNHLL